MFQQRPVFVRCFIACLMTVLGLLAVSSLAIGAATPHDVAAARNQAAAITPTTAIDLSLENGTFILAPAVSLPGVQSGSVSWGDCNNDGAPDLLLMGQVSPTLNIARVYQRNIAGNFDLAAVLTGVINGAAAWGDYDNDGRLDLALTGESASGPISQLWHNNGGCTFSLAATSLVGVEHGAVAWGDYNADGQLDLLVAGNDGSQPVTKLYRNNHGSFVDSGLSLPGIGPGAAVWGDYDNDGFVDLLLTGSTVGGQPLTQLYHNDRHGALIEVSAGLPALSNSAAAWGDYDNDGHLDLLLEGTNNTLKHVAEIYRNVQGGFVMNGLASNLSGGLDWTGAAWGDYDTDGYFDALISSNGYAEAYRNEMTGTFANGINILGNSGLTAGSAAWGHYDSDGILDVAVTGLSLDGIVSRIYRYSTLTANFPPTRPTNLASTVVGSDVVLHWSPVVSDDHTLPTGLSYNLRVGTQPGGIDVVAPMALPDTGYRLLPALGNAGESLSYTLRGLALGQKYYWSVQAIDTSFLGSRFAEESVFLVPYRAFLPLVMKNAVNYYANEWETEPNNTYLQANGPLQSGRVYHGLHDDEKDYYSVYLAAAGTLNVDMASPNGGTQIQLFYQIADVNHRIDYDSTPPYHIGYTGLPGWYYIYVYTNPAYVGTQVYTLKVTYP
jgi:hypothetical protein